MIMIILSLLFFSLLWQINVLVYWVGSILIWRKQPCRQLMWCTKRRPGFPRWQTRRTGCSIGRRNLAVTLARPYILDILWYQISRRKLKTTKMNSQCQSQRRRKLQKLQLSVRLHIPSESLSPPLLKMPIHLNSTLKHLWINCFSACHWLTGDFLWEKQIRSFCCTVFFRSHKLRWKKKRKTLREPN